MTYFFVSYDEFIFYDKKQTALILSSLLSRIFLPFYFHDAVITSCWGMKFFAYILQRASELMGAQIKIA